MENKIKISQLPLETILKEDSLIPIVQDNSTKAIKSKDLLKEVDSEIVKINEQLDNIANKGTTVEVLERVTKEEINKQIEDGRITNLTIKDRTINSEKIKKGAILLEHESWLNINRLNLFNIETAAIGKYLNVKGEI